jgi:hypothetical protein
MTAHDGGIFYAGGIRYRIRGIDTPELGTPVPRRQKHGSNSCSRVALYPWNLKHAMYMGGRLRLFG